MVITERKAVALDAAVDVLISQGHVKPLRWWRGNIKKVYAYRATARFRIEFWINRDPNQARSVVVELYKSPEGPWGPEKARMFYYSDGVRHDHRWEWLFTGGLVALR